MPKQLCRLLAASLLSVSICACSGQKAAESGGTGAQGGAAGARGGRGAGGGPVPVLTARAQTKSVPLTVPAVGTVEALSTVQIRAQITGQLSDIHFTEGQDVRKGQTLFTIDARPFEAALKQAEAVLARDTATAKNSQSQQARFEDLYKRGLIPRDQYETQTATVAAQQATLAADQAAVETARLNLQYTTITAPISGRAGAVSLHAGDLVRANDTTPLLVINQMSPIYVTFSVPGRYLTDVRRFQARRPLPVQASIQNSPARQLPLAVPSPAPSPGMPSSAPTSGTDGTAAEGFSTALPVESGAVSFIDNAVDPTTGTIKLKATFPNTSHALWPGLFVQVSLQLTTDPNAVVVPSAAVQESQQGQYVYVVKPDHTAEFRNVRVERQQGDEMIIAQGVSSGEEVVTDGHLRLTPGARVTTGGGGREGGAPGRGRGGDTGQATSGGEGRRGGKPL